MYLHVLLIALETTIQKCLIQLKCSSLAVNSRLIVSTKYYFLLYKRKFIGRWIALNSKKTTSDRLVNTFRGFPISLSKKLNSSCQSNFQYWTYCYCQRQQCKRQTRNHSLLSNISVNLAKRILSQIKTFLLNLKSVSSTISVA